MYQREGSDKTMSGATHPAGPGLHLALPGGLSTWLTQDKLLAWLLLRHKPQACTSSHPHPNISRMMRADSPMYLSTIADDTTCSAK
jgi:hypothetical protein